MMVYENEHTLHIGPWWRSIALSSRRTECRLIKFTGLWMLLQVSFHTSSRRKTKFVVHICCLSLFPSYALFHYAFCVCRTSSQYVQMGQRSVIRGCEFISCWPGRHNRKNNGHEVIFGRVSRFAETRAESQLALSIKIREDHDDVSSCQLRTYHDCDHDHAAKIALSADISQTINHIVHIDGYIGDHLWNWSRPIAYLSLF